MTSPFNKSNTFDLTHEHLATYEMGYLYPNACIEVVPGDTMKMQSEAFSRFEAMIAPQMSHVDKYQYWFYVPNRILFDDWEKYITGGKTGADTTVKPYMVSPSGGYAIGSLADHFGIPTGVAGLKHSALPFRAYAKIMNDWFLDENLDTMFTENTSSGLDSTTNTTLQKKRWEKDYFTNCLPYAEQGGQASYLPIGQSAPVKTSSSDVISGGQNALKLLSSTDGSKFPDSKHLGIQGDDGRVRVSNESFSYGSNSTVYPSNLYADLTSATAVSINAMRVAFQVQRYLEKSLRGGFRLVEWTLSHFGVRIPDSRLQRSEYLGGGRCPIVVSAVEQNSSTDNTSPQGNLAGRGTEPVNVNGFRKSFCEQGFIIGLVCYLPRTLYSQGLHRMWTRDSRYEEFLPVFAHLGEQEVKNKEIYAQGTSADEGTFGYQDRYQELRYLPSSVHGQFRPSGSLNYWTLARQFNSLPQLNSSFVTADPSNRIFAVTSGIDHITAHFIHHCYAIRPLPKYGAPGLIDHD